MSDILLPHQLQWSSSFSFEITHLGVGLQISNQAAVNKKLSEEKKASLQRDLSPTNFPGAKTAEEKAANYSNTNWKDIFREKKLIFVESR